jgi:hypothetical protein
MPSDPITPGMFRPDDPTVHQPSRTFVLMALTATVFLMITTVGLLIYRSIRFQSPDFVLIVTGNESWRGTEVFVDGQSLAQPYHVILETYNKYRVPFFLTEGDYQVRVVRGDREIRSSHFTVGSSHPQHFVDLPDKPPSTQPS